MAEDKEIVENPDLEKWLPKTFKYRVEENKEGYESSLRKYTTQMGGKEEEMQCTE